jgi:tripartite-type tricarboxylate transporter receptor subunit TctC
MLGAAATLVPAALARPALAVGVWPDRPVRLVVGFSAGGPTDTVGRLLGQGVSEAIGQPVPVENRTGAAGNIATEAVARSAPDGTTFLVANVGQIVINPHTYDRMTVDPMRDLVPVAALTMSGLLIAAHPRFATSHEQLVARLRREPGQHKYATSGAGGISHVVQELWRRRLDLDVTAVHYRGAAAMLPEMLGGMPPFGLDTVILFEQHIRNGALAGMVNIAAARSPVVPAIPTSAEVGLNDFVFDNWFGLFAPRGTPQPIIDRMVAATGRSLAIASTVERLAAGGMQVIHAGPYALRARAEREFRLYGDAIRAGGIRADS